MDGSRDVCVCPLLLEAKTHGFDTCIAENRRPLGAIMTVCRINVLCYWGQNCRFYRMRIAVCPLLLEAKRHAFCTCRYSNAAVSSRKTGKNRIFHRFIHRLYHITVPNATVSIVIAGLSRDIGGAIADLPPIKQDMHHHRGRKQIKYENSIR